MAEEFSIRFDRRQERQILEALRVAPAVMLRNIDAANRRAASGILRDSIKNLTSGSGPQNLTGVDTGQLKSKVIMRKTGPMTYEVGPTKAVIWGRFLETGTGVFRKPVKSKGRFKSNLRKGRGRPITRSGGKFFGFELKDTGKRRQKKVALPKHKSFIVKEGGKVIFFTTMLPGLEARFWLSTAGKANIGEQELLVRGAIEISARQIAQRGGGR